jgi:hypothetical protein
MTRIYLTSDVSIADAPHGLPRGTNNEQMDPETFLFLGFMVLPMLFVLYGLFQRMGRRRQITQVRSASHARFVLLSPRRPQSSEIELFQYSCQLSHFCGRDSDLRFDGRVASLRQGSIEIRGLPRHPLTKVGSSCWHTKTRTPATRSRSSSNPCSWTTAPESAMHIMACVCLFCHSIPYEVLRHALRVRRTDM